MCSSRGRACARDARACTRRQLGWRGKGTEWSVLFVSMQSLALNHRVKFVAVHDSAETLPSQDSN